MKTRRKQITQRERLSERTSFSFYEKKKDDAIVRTYENRNRKRSAEMTDPLRRCRRRATTSIYLTPSSGNLPTNPTPVSLLLQEVSVEFKGDLKKLYTQYQFPIATARGKVDITGKAKVVDYDPDPVNQTFWAQAIAVGMEIPVNAEAHTIPASSPFVAYVTNNTTYGVDHGVVYTTGTAAGQQFLNVSPSFPSSAAQYTVNTTSGEYQFASVDNSLGVAISYTYSNSTRGKTISLSAQLMGYAPVCTIDVWGSFRQKYVGIRLNACTLGSWSYPTKLEDFWMLTTTSSFIN